MRHATPKSAYLLLASALFATVVLMVSEPSMLVSLRHSVFDHYQRWKPAAQVEEPVLIVDIDDESLARLGQWPWPRSILAQLADRLVAAQVAAIGFDAVFAEPDRTSPTGIAAQLRVSPAFARLLASLPDHDEVFALSLARAPAALGFALGGPARWPDAQPPVSRFVLREGVSFERLAGAGAGLFPLPALSAAATLGAINFLPDEDGVVRRVPLLLESGGSLLPALSLEVLRIARGAGNFIVGPNAQGGLDLAVGGLRIPLSADGVMWARYAPPRADRYLSAWRVLEGEIEPERLRGRTVLIGPSAPTLMDLRFSPLGGVVPGVEVHAQLIERMLAGDHLVRPDRAMALEVLILLVAGGLVAWFGLRANALFAAAVTGGVLVVMMFLGWQAYAGHGLLIDVAVPGLFVGLVFVAASLVRHSQTERRQRWIRQVFSRYVSPNLVDYLVEHADSVELGGVRRDCSFVFTDLAGYTALIERQDPAAVVSLVNRYLDGMIEVVFRHNGTLSKIIGDGLVVMFSAPVVQPDHAARALACADELRRFATDFARALEREGVAWGETRIGVHSGEVIVGNLGGATIFDYAALGDPVNIASRLEGANKFLGTQVCVSAATLGRCPGAVVRPAARLVLKGRSGAVTTHELLAAHAGAGRDPDYEQAYALLARSDPRAFAAFRDLAAARPGDPLVALHLRRLVAGETGDLIVLTDK